MKIKAININSFRGIPNEFHLDFSDRNGNPLSALIFGDNGSGKSSIIDALEYNLQGKIERSDSLRNEFRPYPVSLNQKIENGAMTSIIFENDDIFERNILVSIEDDNKVVFEKSNNQLHPLYKIAPFILRRTDITNYSTIPIQKKQLLFWSFIYDTSKDVKTEHKSFSRDKALIQSLEIERLETKKLRNNKLTDLAKVLNIAEDSIPFGNQNEFLEFIKRNIRKGFSPYQIKELRAKGRVIGINEGAGKIANDILSKNVEIKKIQDKISNLKKIDSPSADIRKKQIVNFIICASKSLSESFKKISSVDFVDEIIISIGELTEVSFEIIVKLKNGKIIAPEKIFSEANLDLLILLLFTSLIKESEKYGQSKLIVLDDVLQSVDSSIRLNFIEFMMDEFSDWQIIITAHDRLWLNQLRSSFKRHQHKFKEFEIYKWDFHLGPQISEISSSYNISPIDIALNTKNVQIIASQSGLIFESICQKLSMSLNTSIQRQFEDRYTIGDLWPSIKKYLKKSKLLPLTEEIDKLLYIRNLLGAHYNEWAVSLTNEEIYRFANLIKELYSFSFCETCQAWISSKGEYLGQCVCKKKIIE